MGSDNIERYKVSQLRKVQIKQLTILKEIDRICKKHHIEYWLDGGTLLGAVRHRGFIPWDDDIDIAMKASDLKQFETIAKKELPTWLFLQNRQTDPYCKEDITKIRDLNSLYIEYSDTFNQPYEMGIFVDIFPMIPYPSISRGFAKKLCRGYSVANTSLNRMAMASCILPKTSSLSLLLLLRVKHSVPHAIQMDILPTYMATICNCLRKRNVRDMLYSLFPNYEHRISHIRP